MDAITRALTGEQKKKLAQAVAALDPISQLLAGQDGQNEQLAQTPAPNYQPTGEMRSANTGFGDYIAELTGSPDMGHYAGQAAEYAKMPGQFAKAMVADPLVDAGTAMGEGAAAGDYTRAAGGAALGAASIFPGTKAGMTIFKSLPAMSGYGLASTAASKTARGDYSDDGSPMLNALKESVIGSAKAKGRRKKGRRKKGRGSNEALKPDPEILKKFERFSDVAGREAYLTYVRSSNNSRKKHRGAPTKKEGNRIRREAGVKADQYQKTYLDRLKKLYPPKESLAQAHPALDEALDYLPALLPAAFGSATKTVGNMVHNSRVRSWKKALTKSEKAMEGKGFMGREVPKDPARAVDYGNQAAKHEEVYNQNYSGFANHAREELPLGTMAAGGLIGAEARLYRDQYNLQHAPEDSAEYHNAERVLGSPDGVMGASAFPAAIGAVSALTGRHMPMAPRTIAPQARSAALKTRLDPMLMDARDTQVTRLSGSLKADRLRGQELQQRGHALQQRGHALQQRGQGRRGVASVAPETNSANQGGSTGFSGVSNGPAGSGQGGVAGVGAGQAPHVGRSPTGGHPAPRPDTQPSLPLPEPGQMSTVPSLPRPPSYTKKLSVFARENVAQKIDGGKPWPEAMALGGEDGVTAALRAQYGGVPKSFDRAHGAAVQHLGDMSSAGAQITGDVIRNMPPKIGTQRLLGLGGAGALATDPILQALYAQYPPAVGTEGGF